MSLHWGCFGGGTTLPLAAGVVGAHGAVEMPGGKRPQSGAWKQGMERSSAQALESDRPGFRPWLYHILIVRSWQVVWLWSGLVPELSNLYLLIHKTEIRILWLCRQMRWCLQCTQPSFGFIDRNSYSPVFHSLLVNLISSQNLKCNFTIMFLGWLLSVTEALDQQLLGPVVGQEWRLCTFGRPKLGRGSWKQGYVSAFKDEGKWEPNLEWKAELSPWPSLTLWGHMP